MKNNANRKKTTPWVPFRGPSPIDGKPVRAVAYTLYPSGAVSRKVGEMAQLMICPDDVPPQVAVKDGSDRSVCGDCPNRLALGGGCYVVPQGFPVRRPWETSLNQPTDLDGTVNALRACGLPLRIGSWGDPAVVPTEVLAQLVDSAAGHTGYTSMWRNCDPALRQWTMASVLSPDERDEAHERGWRTFRIRTLGTPLLKGEITCPASAEAGKRTSCSKCLVCSGAGDQTGPDIAIVAHGSEWKQDRVRATLRRAGKHQCSGPSVAGTKPNSDVPLPRSGKKGAA